MLAKAIEISENAKIGLMSTTYAGRASCPSTCRLKAAGACYGDCGPTMFQWSKLDNWGTPEQVARAEAASIDKLSGLLDLRLHTVGDCATTKAAKIVAAACKRYIARGLAKTGRAPKVYTYTHAWAVIPRKAWGEIEILASCETIADVKAAHKRGYQASIMVKAFSPSQPFESATLRVVEGVKVLPCPKQTGKSESCADCRLCLNASKMNKTVIALATHGPSKKANAMLDSINIRDLCKA